MRGVAMEQVLHGVWVFFRGVTKAVQFLIGVILVLGAAAEVASLTLDHGSFVLRNVKNIVSIFGPDEPTEPVGTTPETSLTTDARCIRYDKRVIDLRCDERTHPLDKALCQVTFPPTELVCVEYSR
jgi:hypothetical protein